jgi:hypothetical protein
MWKRFLSWWREDNTPEDPTNPRGKWLLVYETPEGPAIIGRYKGLAEDAMEAAQAAVANMMFESGSLDQGPRFGNYGIIKEDDLTAEQRAQIDSLGKGDK